MCLDDGFIQVKITTPAVKTYTYIARLTDNSLESI